MASNLFQQFLTNGFDKELWKQLSYSEREALYNEILAATNSRVAELKTNKVLKKSSAYGMLRDTGVNLKKKFKASKNLTQEEIVGGQKVDVMTASQERRMMDARRMISFLRNKTATVQGAKDTYQAYLNKGNEWITKYIAANGITVSAGALEKMSRAWQRAHDEHGWSSDEEYAQGAETIVRAYLTNKRSGYIQMADVAGDSRRLQQYRDEAIGTAYENLGTWEEII